MAKSMNMVNANIRIDAELLEFARSAADELGVSLSNFTSMLFKNVKKEWKIVLNLVSNFPKSRKDNLKEVKKSKEIKDEKYYDKLFNELYESDEFYDSIKKSVDEYESWNMENFIEYKDIDELKKELNLS